MRTLLSVAAAALLALSGAAAVPAADTPSWVAAWGLPVNSSKTTSFSNKTIRMVERVSFGGSRVRVRLSNANGSQALTLTDAHVGLAGAGATVKPGTDVPLTFGGSSSVTIPTGASTLSDPVDLTLKALDNVVVSVFAPASTGQGTGSGELGTYYTATGDHAGDAGATAFGSGAAGGWFVTGIDVYAPNDGLIVAFGDSITVGYNASNQGWPYWLANRLVQLAASGGPRLSVVNMGISGNEVSRDRPSYGVSAEARLQRDVLVQSGLRLVLMMEGINDLGADAVPADQIEASYARIAQRVQAAGARILLSPLTPAGDAARPNQYGTNYWSPSGVQERHDINSWIRASALYDPLLDFDPVVKDAIDPDHLAQSYDSGDGLHPSIAGQQAMADSIDFWSPAFIGAAPPPATVSPQPGPSILYWPAPRAPQLENVAPWKAAPILVSGTSAYRGGEFLYQDYLFDDRGAGSTATYPADPRYAKDAADLVELRLEPHDGGLLLRLTYNAMIDPALVASTIALGDSATPRALPFAAGADEPAQTFVTVHGTTVAVTDAATGKAIAAPDAKATVDLARRQVQVFVPKSVIATDKLATLRVASASGTWDAANNRYARLFNVAFRYAESGEWRDAAQAAALTAGHLAPFSAQVDFRKLRAKATDDSGVPTHGMTYRIYASHFEDAQGRGPQPGTQYCHEPCWNRVPDYASQLQPYSLYVPDKPPPAGGYGMTLNLHYCSGNYNDGPPDAQALANRGTGSVVLTTEDRGPCFWYWSEAGADTFEAWADVGRHFKLDPLYNAISGWSMGGYGTYKLVAQYPDLFARALPDIGCVSAETGWAGEPSRSTSGPAAEILNLVPSFRNVPIFAANAGADQYCLNSSQDQVLEKLDELGYRVDWREYDGNHGPYYPTPEESASFLGDTRVDSNPPHVSWVDDGPMQEPKYGLDSDHAYWLSGVAIRDAAVNNDLGTVDAFSHGFGLADPVANAPVPTAGTSGTYAYAGQNLTWQPAQAAPATDVLDLKLTNISAVTVDPARAHLTCNATVNGTSDGPATVTLAGCNRTFSLP